MILSAIQEHEECIKKFKTEYYEQKINLLANVIKKSLYNNGTIFFLGNGGSAADAQHFAAELVGRFQKERSAIAAIALTTDTSILTSIANDYDFSNIYARQVQALVKENDVVIGISTSGNSLNVLNAIQAAKAKGAITIALSGLNGGKLKEVSDYSLCVPSNKTSRIQELHILTGHILCELIEEDY